MSGRAVVSYGEGRHVVVVAAREELATPARVSLPEPEPAPGLILPSGEINWGCPCLGGMATGPCGSQFRDAFSCFHYSEAEPKGGDCYEKFSVMQQCMSQYPELYGKDDGDDELAAALEDSAAAPASTGAASVGAASTGAASAGAASTGAASTGAASAGAASTGAASTGAASAGAASTGAASAGAAYTASSAATDNTQN